MQHDQIQRGGRKKLIVSHWNIYALLHNITLIVVTSVTSQHVRENFCILRFLCVAAGGKYPEQLTGTGSHTL